MGVEEQNDASKDEDVTDEEIAELEQQVRVRTLEVAAKAVKSVDEKVDGSTDADTREEKLAELKQQAHDNRLRLIELIAEIADHRFDVFATWACEAALGIESENGPLNPLLERDEDGKVVPAARYCSQIARILLAKLKGESQPDGPIFEGYLSILEWMKSRITEPKRVYSFSLDRARSRARVDFVVNDFFDEQEELFGDVARWALELVYQGVPLYATDAKGSALHLVPYSHEDYVYLSKKGEHFDSAPMYRLPFWTSTCYFSGAHLDAHAIFFSGDLSDHSKEAIAVLRAAFRKYIGIEVESHAGESASRINKEHSSLLALVPKVLDRYYGAEYVKTNPDTWTTQTVVVKWLMDSFAISEREASAIDIVTRPDQQRRKSR
jgi:hypothetical protein